MHDYHEGLPGYDPAQIWHDGCGECEACGQSLAIGKLDSHDFSRAWQRAAEWNRVAGLPNVARAEMPLLKALWAVQIKLEDRGIPIGQVPGRDPSEAEV